MTSSPGLKPTAGSLWSVTDPTDDDRRQRPLLVRPPTLCVGGPVIIGENGQMTDNKTAKRHRKYYEKNKTTTQLQENLYTEERTGVCRKILGLHRIISTITTETNVK